MTSLAACFVLIASCISFASAQYDFAQFNPYDYGESGDVPFSTGMNYQIGFPTCDKLHDNGTQTSVQYDECTSFCCGGEVYQNATGLDCCGSVMYGSPYYPRVQHCCLWWTGHGKGYLKRSFKARRHGIGCCGANRIVWGLQSCCYGDRPPQVYDEKKSLCCHGNPVPYTTKYSWQSRCCGTEEVYDMSRQACPCDDGGVVDARPADAACCKTVDGFKAPYMTKTQICCNGRVGDMSDSFCCGETELGRIGTEVCCDGVVVTMDKPDPNKTECCAGVPYNPDGNLCCEGVIMEMQVEGEECCGAAPYNPSESVCCEGQTWSRASQGTECCANYAFFPGKGSFCCNGVVQIIDIVGGDACCGGGQDVNYYFTDDNSLICCAGQLALAENGDTCCDIAPYFEHEGICCDGEVFDKSLGDTCCNGSPYFKTEQGEMKTVCCDNGPYGPFRTPACCNGVGYDIQGGQLCCAGTVFGVYRQPACCVDVGYDVTTHQCCKGLVVANPEGAQFGSCCGSQSYDRDRSICCGGEMVVDIPAGIPPSKAQCCDVTTAYYPEDELCCDGTIFNKTSKYLSKCCGEKMYNTSEQLCCEPENGEGGMPTLYDFVYGADDTKCCGAALYNSAERFCCDGYLQAQVYDHSGCCSGATYDKTAQICCENQLRTIGENVPWQKAECCGPECMYAGPMRCCNDRIYMSNARTNTTCETY